MKHIVVNLVAAFGLICAATAGANTSTADHSQFKELQQDFKSGPEVTKACLKCHTEAAQQIMKTKHWTWEYVNPETGQMLGKRHVLNNFCISIETNQSHCSTCHAGYGFSDNSFDFNDPTKVDCLVCHDASGKYHKEIGMAGNVVTEPIVNPETGKTAKPVDLKQVAQNVGKPSRDNCGACHFYSGGGDGVKHGDLDSSLAAPDADLDVHMDVTGLDFSCVTCHQTEGHDVPGSRYAPTAKDDAGKLMRGKEAGRNPATCQSCHGNDPHTVARLNTHARRIACQTCHIPSFARGGIPTKMDWDWSTSGQKDADGKPLFKRDAKGHIIYDARKGSFVLEENVVPTYIWFNGTVQYTLLNDKVEKGPTPTPINKFLGSPDDGKSLIWPVKVMHGRQPYDTVNHTLVKPHTAGEDSTAYWINFGWEPAIATGMAAAGAPFSGKYDFVETEMTWPITHMVAPKDKALKCVDCHAANSRLAGLPGLYMPSYTRYHWLDLIGWGIAAASLFGVFVHGAGRFYASRRK